MPPKLLQPTCALDGSVMTDRGAIGKYDNATLYLTGGKPKK